MAEVRVPVPDLWMYHFACGAWSECDRWSHYFDRAQGLLEANITHLDQNDPVRRRVKTGTSSDLANYVTALGKRENDRWVFGRIESLKVEFSIRHHREVRNWPHSISWYFPPQFQESPGCIDRLCQLFDLGNTAIEPFYGYADTKDRISAKKKPSGSVDIQAELLGVFWLTYFDSHYVNFFGTEKINGLKSSHVKIDGGATLRLGETPSQVPLGLQDDLQAILGQNTFVEPGDAFRKRPGQYALTFDQIRTK